MDRQEFRAMLEGRSVTAEKWDSALALYGLFIENNVEAVDGTRADRTHP